MIWALACLTVAMTGLSSEALAQSVSFDFGPDDASTTGRVVQLLLFLTVISVAPAILMMVTAFTRVVVVLSILRRAFEIGLPRMSP